jgi:hypothetical protein
MPASGFSGYLFPLQGGIHFPKGTRKLIRFRFDLKKYREATNEEKIRLIHFGSFIFPSKLIRPDNGQGSLSFIGCTGTLSACSAGSAIASQN